jgi:hypothetical protein
MALGGRESQLEKAPPPLNLVAAAVQRRLKFEAWWESSEVARAAFAPSLLAEKTARPLGAFISPKCGERFSLSPG